MLEVAAAGIKEVVVTLAGAVVAVVGLVKGVSLTEIALLLSILVNGWLIVKYIALVGKLLAGGGK